MPEMPSPRGPPKKRISPPVAAVKVAPPKRSRTSSNTPQKNSDSNQDTSTTQKVIKDEYAKSAGYPVASAMNKQAVPDSEKNKHPAHATSKQKMETESRRVKDNRLRRGEDTKQNGALSSGLRCKVKRVGRLSPDDDEEPVVRSTAKTRRQRQLKLMEQEEDQADDQADSAHTEKADNDTSTTENSSVVSKGADHQSDPSKLPLPSHEDTADEAPPAKKRRLAPPITRKLNSPPESQKKEAVNMKKEQSSDEIEEEKESVSQGTSTSSNTEEKEESPPPSQRQTVDDDVEQNLPPSQEEGSEPTKLEEKDAAVQPPPTISRNFTHTAALFRKMPPGLMNKSPVVVLDNWKHGQLVWWNRFLANRKKSQGTSVGNFVGRAVDLDSEWFPSTELGSMKSRLRSLAAAMGRRSLFVQSLDEMRYLTLPPRAVSVRRDVIRLKPFPDPDSTRHGELLTGLYRGGTLNARKGLQIALMIEELRDSVGEINSLLEIEFLDLCMTSEGLQDEDELTQLESLSAFDVLKHRKFTGIEGTRSCNYSAGISAHIKSTSDNQPGSILYRGISPVVKRGRGRGRGANGRMISESYTISATRRGRGRRVSQVSTPSSPAGDEDLPKRNLKIMEKSQLIDHCKSLIESVCLKRSELLFLLRGVPATLLASSTGIPLPEEPQAFTLNILESLNVGSAKTQQPQQQQQQPYSDNNNILSYSVFSSSPAAARLLGLHLSIANYFMHRLLRTVALRIILKAPSPPQPPASLETNRGMCMPNQNAEVQPTNIHPPPAPHDFFSAPSYGRDGANKLTSLPQPNQFNVMTDAQKESFEPSPQERGVGPLLAEKSEVISPLVVNGSNQKLTSSVNTTTPPDFKVVLSMDFVHHRPVPKSSISPVRALGDTASRLYTLRTPFICAHYGHVIMEKESSGKAENTLTDGEKVSSDLKKIAKCIKSSIRIIGFGCLGKESNRKGGGYCCATLNQISEHAPSASEAKVLAELIVTDDKCRVTTRELEKRAEDLSQLKEVAAYLRSIYEDIISAIAQANGTLTPEDGRYFESLWLDLQKKLQN